MTDEHRFTAPLRRLGINFAVDVPARVSAAFASRGPIPVAGTVNDSTPLRSTLVPRGEGRHRLFLNGEVRALANVGEGDRVRIAIVRDDEPRDTIPPDLAAALREARVLDVFEGFTAFRKREIAAWIDDARRDETRAKRIAKAVEHTIAKAEKHVDAPATRTRTRSRTRTRTRSRSRSRSRTRTRP